MRTISCGLLVLLMGCRHEAETPPPVEIGAPVVAPVADAASLPETATPAARSGRAPSIQRKPTMWSHVADWPDPVAVVDGTPVAKKDLVAELQAGVEGGVLANDVDEVTGLRAAATALEARIDALIVQKAVATDAGKADAAVQVELARELATTGGREKWLKALKRRGVTEETHMRTLRTQAQLHVLVEKETPFKVTDAELRERYESQRAMLAVPAAVQTAEFSEALPVGATAAQIAQAQARLDAQVSAGKWPKVDSSWQTARALGPERWAALQGLKVGAVTPQVRTAFGLHRLKLLAQRASRQPTFAEAKPQLAAYVQRMKWVPLDAIALAKLRAAAKVQRFSPFDHPPGGLPLSGAVTMAAFEEEED